MRWGKVLLLLYVLEDFGGQEGEVFQWVYLRRIL